MKLLTTILFLTIVLSLSAKPKPCIGYWIVTYDTQNGYKKTGTVEIVDVYIIAETMFPSNCINFNKKLKEKIAFEMNETGIGSKSFYVEVKKIKFNGRFRSLNRKEIKKYLRYEDN